jgi:putative oxidoreductase
MEIGLLLMRGVLGATMAAHGAQKLFGWFGGHGLTGTQKWLGSMGFRPARLQAGVVGLSEFGGGALLAAGLLTPFAAAAVAGVMLVAIAIVHWSNGFFSTNGGYEFNLLIVAAAMGLAFTGPGRISLDQLAGWTLAGPAWGVAALGISVAAAGSILAMRWFQLERAREQRPRDVTPG